MSYSMTDPDLSKSNFKVKPYQQHPDVSLLVTQNQTLASELAQCQADKEFVWSLWKKLQVSNPDVTEAIALVTQREKEKSENKDRKVLEIIQVKDDRIEELQDIVTKQAEEISNVLSKKGELTEKVTRLQLENDRLSDRINMLDCQVRSDVNKEKHLEDTFRRTVEGSEKEKYELSRKVSRLTSDLDVAKSEKMHALNRQKILEERIRTLEREVSDKMVKFQDLVREVEDSSTRLTRYEAQTSQQRRDLEFKNQELENVRKELKELWHAHNQLTEHSGQQADLIRQLQSLQQDTQKMLKNQEDAFSLESTSLQQMFTDVNTRYEAAKRMESDLRQQVLELKKSLMDKDDIISSLQSQEMINKQMGHISPRHPEYTGSFLDIVKEVDSIPPKEMGTKRGRGRSLNRSPELDKNISCRETPRPRSLSPPTVESEPRFEPFDVRKVGQLQKELLAKTRQVEELRRAHDNRLHRFQDLQASYKLAREQIKTLEFGCKPKQKKIKRADPRSLQKENSDEVWNELSYFKAENRTLHIDKMSLQEEVDLLRVQAAQDNATVHELKVSLLGQREEFEFQLRSLQRENKESRETDKQLSLLKSQVQNKIVHIEKLDRDLLTVMSQRDDLVQEKSKLMSQLVTIQQEASQHRMELADCKHQLQSVKRQLEEHQQTSLRAESDDDNRKPPNAELVNTLASNLRARNKRKFPCSKMTSVLNEGNDEEWVEMSDTDDSEPGTQSSNLNNTFHWRTSRRNGQSARHISYKNLTKVVQPRRVPTHRPPVTKNKHSVPDKASYRSRSTSPSQKPKSQGQAGRRDFATSPITFLFPQRTKVPSTLQQKHAVSYTLASHRKARKAADSRQIATLQQRIAHLLNQVAIMRRAKMSAVELEEKLRDTVNKLQSELASVTGRLKASKQLVQKLQDDIEKMHKEKQELELAVSKSEMKPEATSAESLEIKAQEAKLKLAATEATRQAAAIKNLKTENESLHEQVRSMQDRMNHLERDVNQKRILLESQKLKLKQFQEINKTEADNLEELETKMKLLTDANNKMKVQVDSLRKRLSLVVKEKKGYEDKFLKVSLDLEDKTKQLFEVTSHRMALETALSDLESSAQQQLHGLASQSEAAIDTAREKLTVAQTRLLQFHSAIKILATELVNRTEKARSRLKEAITAQERRQRDDDPSLQKAQDKAKDILNLSQSDLDDIMSADGDGQESLCADEKKMDKRWLRKCDKIMNSKDDFVHPLISLLLKKIDERTELLLNVPK